MHKYALITVLLILGFSVQAQQVVITGKVSDVITGEPLSNVLVFTKGAKKGARTNFDGTYELILSSHVGEIQARHGGYLHCVEAIGTSPKQVINLQLLPHDFHNNNSNSKVIPEVDRGVVNYFGGGNERVIKDEPLRDYLKTKSGPNIPRK